MQEEIVLQFVKCSTGAGQVVLQSRVQDLWGAQGQLLRVSTDLPAYPTLIVKYIAPSDAVDHPRGWNTSRSFARKARSYQIECQWYRHFADRCTKHCKVPKLLGLEQNAHHSLVLLEDLSVAYPRLRSRLQVHEVSVCLHWLAEFHALFLHDQGEGLWDQGCYWHLDTRPDEWQAMPEGELKQAAQWLDEQLRGARFKTLVHGDAKLANFCFSNDMSTVSAVDFQYVGKGCGMRDVVYLLGSSLSEEDCQCNEEHLLSSYFAQLAKSLRRRYEQGGNPHDGLAATTITAAEGNPLQRLPGESIAIDEQISQIEYEWRELYAIAWTDFYRFLLGWMPAHAKINDYTRTLASRAIGRWRREVPVPDSR